jgi:polysaccharide export outer membrane protein
MNRLFLFIAIAITVQSCVPSKRLYYFHNQVPGVQPIDREKQSAIQLIKQGDRLQIQVSIPDAAQEKFLNPYSSAQQNLQQQAAQGMAGYLVNKAGEIDFPSLGKINVLNMTPEAAADSIKNKLSFYYKDPFVVVNIQGRIYYLSGRGGTIVPIINERLTIFEAITQATGQDPYDLRDQLWLIREENNERTFVQLNLSDKSIFESPYYYLRNNDQLYMRPGKFSNAFAANSPVGFALALSGLLLTVLLLIRTL